MFRPIRIAYPKAWYHVMNRGRRTENIFFGKIRLQNVCRTASGKLGGVEHSNCCILPDAKPFRHKLFNNRFRISPEWLGVILHKRMLVNS